MAQQQVFAEAKSRFLTEIAFQREVAIDLQPRFREGQLITLQALPRRLQRERAR